MRAAPHAGPADVACATAVAARVAPPDAMRPPIDPQAIRLDQRRRIAAVGLHLARPRPYIGA